MKIVNYIGLYETAAIMYKITVAEVYPTLSVGTIEILIHELENYFRFYMYTKTYSWYNTDFDRKNREFCYILYR